MKNLSPVGISTPFCGPHRKVRTDEAVQERSSAPKGLVGAASLAVLTGVSMAPQVAQAANVGKHMAKVSPELTDMFTSSTTQVGDYTLRFRPADLDITPKLSHMKPGLRVKGEFLDAELAKSVSLEGGWTRTQGLRGRVHGDINTFGDTNASVNLEGFRRWEGDIKPGLHGKFEVSGGAYQDLVHNSTAVGMQFYQEVKGGDFTFHDQPLSWHLEGRQNISQRVRGSVAEPSRQFHYEFLVGVRRDYPMKIFGRPAVVSTVLGPSFHGNQDKSFEVSPKLKVRVNL